MITHVVMFRWKPEITEAEIDAVTAGLDGLPGLVPAIREYRHGGDAALAGGNFDYAIVATFDDEDGWRAYDTDPNHDRVRTELIRPWVAERAAVQFRS